MGMDVYGKNPDSEAGKYFRNNVWWWRPLAQYLCHVAPGLMEKVRYLHSNDGDGLGAKDSLKLALLLRQELESGRTAEYATAREAAMEALPDEPCELCKGTGIRKPVPDTGAGDPQNGGVKCNSCDGKGTKRPFDTWYTFDVDNVREFCDFLEHCGGFEIC